MGQTLSLVRLSTRQGTAGRFFRAQARSKARWRLGVRLLPSSILPRTTSPQGAWTLALGVALAERARVLRFLDPNGLAFGGMHGVNLLLYRARRSAPRMDTRGSLYPFSPLFRPAPVKGDHYVVLAALWPVVNLGSVGNDACLRPDVRCGRPAPWRPLRRMLRAHAKR